MGALDNPLARERAVRAFREAFARFNLTVLTDEDPAPQAPYSVIHIGPASPGLDHLGHAEIIDYPNAVLDDAAIIFTGDHGDAFGEHGIYSDHVCADECIHRIPLIVRWPGVTKVQQSITVNNRA